MKFGDFDSIHLALAEFEREYKDMLDENYQLAVELREYANIVGEAGGTECIKGLLSYGKRALGREVMAYALHLHPISVTKNDGISIEPEFDEWFDTITRYALIPDELSRDEVRAIIRDDARSMYAERVSELLGGEDGR